MNYCLMKSNYENLYSLYDNILGTMTAASIYVENLFNHNSGFIQPLDLDESSIIAEADTVEELKYKVSYLFL